MLLSSFRGRWSGHTRDRPLMDCLPRQGHRAVGLPDGFRIPGICHIGPPHQHLLSI